MSAVIPTVNPIFAARLNHRNASPYKDAWLVLDQVFDPELPGVTIWDLGILQDVRQENGHWQVDITLTYSGCPAVSMIKQNIIDIFHDNKLTETQQITVNILLSPAWSTDLISPAGKEQLRKLSIAPPETDEANISCPNCHSMNTEILSEFGSTACKAMYRCQDCLEPFDYFKHLQ